MTRSRIGVLIVLGVLVHRAAAAPAADPARVVLPAPPEVPADKALTIVGPGLRTAIVIGDAQPPYRFPYWGGHAILRQFLEHITKQPVPIIKASNCEAEKDALPRDVRLWVGDQPRVREAIGKQLDALDDDGFIIRAAGKDVHVAGKHDWGTHFAAYDLLERFAGCRWYAPGPRFWEPAKDGVVGLFHIVPRAATVRMPADTNIVEEPSYKMRWMRLVPRHEFRMRLRDKFSHNLCVLIPPEPLGKERPDFFPEVQGKRYVPPKGSEHDFQPCTTNPAVVEHMANAIIAHFDKNPQEGTYSVGMNDSGRYCECAKCQAVAPATLTDREHRIAYTFFAFYNQVAERVAAKHPTKRLGCLAYAVLSELPAGAIKLHPAIVPYLTRDSAQLFDQREVAEFREKVTRWHGLAARMGIYEYVYGTGFVIPRIYNRYLLKNIAERYGVGVDGFYAEDYPNWGLDGPKYWLIARMLWNCKLDPEELKRDYFGRLFGPLADAMRAYFELLEETWCTQTLESPRSNYRWMFDPKQLAIFPPGVCDKAWAMLDEAERAAQGYIAATDGEKKAYCQQVAERVAYFKTTFALTRLLSQAYGSRKEPPGLREAYDRIMALQLEDFGPLSPIKYEELVRRYVR
ncbi:MAG: DUF4838 domain-containing protein [Planctomycetes bacterium]|nr:DUF4838 domain-containing protein [Planctomycetota bacterium]